jgi:hypothetical protein
MATIKHLLDKLESTREQLEKEIISSQSVLTPRILELSMVIDAIIIEVIHQRACPGNRQKRKES